MFLCVRRHRWEQQVIVVFRPNYRFILCPVVAAFFPLDACSSMYRMRMIAVGCRFRWTVAYRMLMHHVCHRRVFWFASNMTGAGCKKLIPNELHSCNDVSGFGRCLLNHWSMMLSIHPLCEGASLGATSVCCVPS